MENEVITGRIIKCAFKVHNILGAGFLEKVYEKALIIELDKAGFQVQSQFLLTVYYDVNCSISFNKRKISVCSMLYNINIFCHKWNKSRLYNVK